MLDHEPVAAKDGLWKVHSHAHHERGAAHARLEAACRYRGTQNGLVCSARRALAGEPPA